MKRGVLAGTLTALVLLTAPAVAAAVAGDVYVADQSAGPGGSGAVFRVDLATGATTTVSSGPPLENPADMVFDRDGALIVADDGAEAIFKVDPLTGTATEVARGGELTDPWGVALGPAGRLFVADVGFDSPAAVIFRVNVTGNVGAKIQYASGPPLVDPAGLVRESESAFLVTDLNGAAGAADGIVHRLDAATRGAPVVQVASGPPLVDPWGIAIDAAGRVTIADVNAFGGGGGLFSLDPTTGAVAPLASGSPYTDPIDLAPLPAGGLLVADTGEAGPGALLSFDPATGATVPAAPGAPFVDPSSVVVEPPLCRGTPATIIGSTASDRLTGTRFADVIAALDGNDVIKGGRGNDIVCGGGGRERANGNEGADVVSGEGGSDRLNGSEGADVLIGGPGRDRCNGKSSHRDRASGCEQRIRIP